MSIADAGERYSQHKTELLKFGGNDRFKQFLNLYTEEESEESVFAGMPISQKYATNACKYYRHKIQQLAKQETPLMDAPELIEAKVVLDEDIDGILT